MFALSFPVGASLCGELLTAWIVIIGKYGDMDCGVDQVDLGARKACCSNETTAYCVLDNLIKFSDIIWLRRYRLTVDVYICNNFCTYIILHVSVFS